VQRLLLVAVLLTSVVVVGLLGFILWVSFSHASLGQLTFGAGLANYVALFQNPSFGTVVWNTIWFAIGTVVIAFGFGIPLAWLSERTNLPGRSLIWVTMLASLVVPGFLLAMGWIFIAHPRIGFLNVFLMQLFHLDGPPFTITSVGGMAWVEGIALAPLVFVLIAPSMKAIDASLEEAALMAGAPPGATFSRITLPLLLPAIAAAVIYTAITAIGTFDIPAVIGMSGSVYTFSTFLYVLAYPVMGFPDYTTTAAGGGIMIALALGLSAVYARVLQKARRFQVVTGKAYRPRLVDLGRWKVAAWIFAGGYAGLVLVLPFIMTLIFSLLPTTEPLSAAAFKQLSLHSFAQIPWDLVGRGALHTGELVVAVPLCVIALSFAFSWIVLRTKIRGRLAFDSIAFLPHAVPGVLFGLGATLIALYVLGHFIPIYGSVLMVGIVYTVAWLSLGTRMINSGIIQIHPELEEAAQMAGAADANVFRRVTLPLLKPATQGLWIFTVLLCVRELTLAAFVSTPKNLTLSMVSWYLWNSGSLTQAAAVATLIVLVLGPPLLLYIRFGMRPEVMFQ
jgi:iron(III) transport system permease protein